METSGCSLQQRAHSHYSLTYNLRGLQGPALAPPHPAPFNLLQPALGQTETAPLPAIPIPALPRATWASMSYNRAPKLLTSRKRNLAPVSFSYSLKSPNQTALHGVQSSCHVPQPPVSTSRSNSSAHLATPRAQPGRQLSAPPPTSSLKGRAPTLLAQEAASWALPRENPYLGKPAPHPGVKPPVTTASAFLEPDPQEFQLPPSTLLSWGTGAASYPGTRGSTPTEEHQCEGSRQDF